jgi:hypothetical protein
MIGSFKVLKGYADFDVSPYSALDQQGDDEGDDLGGKGQGRGGGSGDQQGNNIRLGYTIHLNLPATTDIAVFNAIFKSLKEHLL